MTYFYKTIVININNGDTLTINDYVAHIHKGDICNFIDNKLGIGISGNAIKIENSVFIEYNNDNKRDIHQTIKIYVY